MRDEIGRNLLVRLYEVDYNNLVDHRSQQRFFSLLCSLSTFLIGRRRANRMRWRPETATYTGQLGMDFDTVQHVTGD